MTRKKKCFSFPFYCLTNECSERSGESSLVALLLLSGPSGRRLAILLLLVVTGAGDLGDPAALEELDHCGFDSVGVVEAVVEVTLKGEAQLLEHGRDAGRLLLAKEFSVGDPEVNPLLEAGGDVAGELDGLGLGWEGGFEIPVAKGHKGKGSASDMLLDEGTNVAVEDLLKGSRGVNSLLLNACSQRKKIK